MNTPEKAFARLWPSVCQRLISSCKGYNNARWRVACAEKNRKRGPKQRGAA